MHDPPLGALQQIAQPPDVEQSFAGVLKRRFQQNMVGLMPAQDRRKASPWRT